MDIQDLLKDVRDKATKYNDQINRIIVDYSSWWNIAEGHEEETFGEAINKSRTDARRLMRFSESRNSIADFKAMSGDFYKSLRVAANEASDLYEFYKTTGRKRDQEIVDQFLQAIKSTIFTLAFLNTEVQDVGILNAVGLAETEVEETAASPKAFYLAKFPEGVDDSDWRDDVRLTKFAASKLDLGWLTRRSSGSEFNIFPVDVKNNYRLAPVTLIIRTDDVDRLSIQRGHSFTNERQLTAAIDEIAWLPAKVRAWNEHGFVPVSEAEFNFLVNYCSLPPEKRGNKINYGGKVFAVNADVITDKSQDYLDFQSDIDAIAGLIAFKEATLPLAIGLFGNWGSGKSFFMRKLKERIDQHSRENPSMFCEKIVHINFNSWHYSDANLWASLITKIFEDLRKDQGENPGSIATLYRNLYSTQQIISRLSDKINLTKTEYETLAKRKIQLEAEIQTEINTLEGLSPAQMISTAWSDPGLQEDLVAIKNELGDDSLNDIATVRHEVIHLYSFVNKLKESIRIAYKFSARKRVWAIVTAVTLFIIAYLVVNNPFATQDFSDWLAVKIGLIVAAFSQVVVFIAPAMRIVNKTHKRLVNLEKTFEKREDEVRQRMHSRKTAIQQQIDAKKAELQSNEKQLTALELQKLELVAEIADYESGKKLFQFLHDKALDKRYVESLGIISWIRKDFEQLDFLLKLQYEETEAQLNEAGKTKVENVFRIDRVVLYIDDLDRCQPEVVVKVLEAIHLLLAFPLFVVIVGVDPRWIHNSLTDRFGKMLNDKKQDLLENRESPASSFDYIEKIFQIPFALKAITESTRKRFINETLKKDQTKQDLPMEAGVDGGVVVKAGQVNISIATPKPPKVSIIPTERTLPERLTITEDEIAVMRSLAMITGNSPRTIKRYINIYRIIRSHADFYAEEDDAIEYQAAAMVLLGLLISLPGGCDSWLKNIRAHKADLSLEAFLDIPGRPESSGSDVVGYLKKSVMIPVGSSTLGKIQMHKFQINIDLIKRFSFHQYL